MKQKKLKLKLPKDETCVFIPHFGRQLDERVYLPENETIRFFLGSKKRINTAEASWDYVDVKLKNGRLEIRCGYSMKILPEAGNTISVMNERDLFRRS